MKEITIYIENQDFKKSKGYKFHEDCPLAQSIRRHFSYPLWFRVLDWVFSDRNSLRRDVKVGLSRGFIDGKEFIIKNPFLGLEHDYLEALVHERKKVKREVKLIFETEQG